MLDSDSRGSQGKAKSAESVDESMLVFREIPIEDERERMSSRSPALIRICDRQIDRSIVVSIPGIARDLLASQQIMLDAGEDATPVTAVQSFINNAVNLH